MSIDENNSPKPPTYPPQNFGGITNQQSSIDATSQDPSSLNSFGESPVSDSSEPIVIATIKAQEIIRLTAQNPYEQQKQLAAIGRVYIKQQYGIDLP